MDTRAEPGYAANWTTEGTSGEKTVTEAEWPNCTDPTPLLEFLRTSGGTSDRKLRLFAVACCRRIWHLLVAEEHHRYWHKDELEYWRRCQEAVVLAERFADGEATKRQLAAVTAYLRPAFYDPRFTVELSFSAAAVATEAARFATELPLNAEGVATEAAVAAALEAGTHAFPSQRVLAAKKKSHCDLLRDIFGNPFHPVTISPTVLAWKDELVVRLAQAAYEERHLPAGTLDNGRLAALADALEEAGCTDADILGHLRGPGPHVRGCWPVDLCLGKTKGTNMAVWLEWVEKGKVFPLVRGQPVVIGRRHYADIDTYADLDTDMLVVSRRHCEVHWDGCRVWVHDLNSRYGTYINCNHFGDGVHVVEPEGCLLRLGDILRPGPVRFLLATSCRIEPPWLSWHDGLLVSMARQMYDSRDFSDIPVLADALEEAGCANQDILSHCRSGGEHVRGCWLLDLLMGKS